MSKGKKQTTSRPLPETQDAAASNGTCSECTSHACHLLSAFFSVGPGPEKQRTGRYVARYCTLSNTQSMATFYSTAALTDYRH